MDQAASLATFCQEVRAFLDAALALASAMTPAPDPFRAAAAHRPGFELEVEVAKAAIRLHGGLGMTDDLPLGQALCRIMTIGRLF